MAQPPCIGDKTSIFAPSRSTVVARAGRGGDVAVGEGGGSVSERVDNDYPAAVVLHLFGDAHQADIGGHRIPAPEDHRPGVEMIKRVMGDAVAQVHVLCRLPCAAAERAAKRNNFV